MSEDLVLDKAVSSPWLIEVKASDNALAPVVAKNEQVAIDCSERDLVDGAIYAVKNGDQVNLWLFQEGFAGQGPLASGEDIATLSSLAGGFRCSGPLAIGTIKVIGRLVGDVGEALVSKLAAERSLLLVALDDCRSAMRRHSGSLRDLKSTDATQADDTLAVWRRRYDDMMADPSLSKRFALEQRIDAISARLMFLEDRIADAKTQEVADVTAKLQVLWDLHYAPFPATHDDLAARVLASALNGLNSPRNEAGAMTEDDQKISTEGPAIKLVSSPRRR